MPKLKMTDAAVKRVTAAPGERIDYFDDHRDRQRGLVLRVSGSKAQDGGPKVTRTWAVLCRVAGGTKLRRFTIGDYPTYSLAKARDRAGEIVRAANRGIDTNKERKAAVLAAEIAGRDTIEAMADDFIAKHLRAKGRSERHITETRRNFDNHILPRWRGRNIRDITRREVGDLLDAIKDDGSDVRGKDGKKRHLPGGPITANRVLATVRALYNWTIKRGIMESNPASRVEAPGEETSRDRVLSADEIKALWPQFEKMAYPFGLFFELVLATGQRRSEVASMRWDEIDEANNVWTLPRERTKPGRAHMVPLSPLALDILARAKESAWTLAKALHGKKPGQPKLPPYVFTTTGATPISGLSKAKTTIDKNVEKALKAEGKENIPAWRIHDLRRSASTEMARLGITQFMIARVLNHADRTVTAVYNRHEYLAEKRHALDTWAQYLGDLIHPPKDKVTVLAERRGAA